MILRHGKILLPAALLAATGWAVRGADAPVAPATSTLAADSNGTTNSAGLKRDENTNTLAAVVNGHIITVAELQKATKNQIEEFFKETMAQYGPTDQGREAFVKRADEYSAETLSTMIDEELIVEYFHDKQYEWPPAYLDARFDEEMTKQFQGDREKYLKQLQADGITDSEFRQQLENKDIVDAMTQEMAKSATGISPDRIKSYYEENKQKNYYHKESVKVRQIALSLTPPTPDVTPDLILQQAQRITQEARQPGANFAELARRYSTDPTARSGDVPTFSYERDGKSLPPALEDAIFKLQPGEVSDPVTNDKFVLIFKCEEHTPEGYDPLDKVRPQIEKILSDQDQRQAIEKWLAKLRSKAFIINYLYGNQTQTAAR